MRPMLRFRFWLSHVESRRTLPHLQQIPAGDVQKFPDRPERHQGGGSLRRHVRLSFRESLSGSLEFEAQISFFLPISLETTAPY